MSENNTGKSFSDKWHNNQQAFLEQTLREGSEINNWILQRNGFATSTELSSHLKDKKRILDAGCGNGRVSALLRTLTNAQTTEVVGIDLVAAQVAKNNLAQYENVNFYDADLTKNLSHLGLFDFIYCQEVLHHTDNPKQSFANLCAILEKGGELAIYVYKKKAPIREYVDDLLREKMANLPYDDAMKMSEQITNFGKALADANISVSVPAIDALEITEGTYDIQRLIYHFFMKCFWNNELSHHENVVINYDWYHPQNCTRHTMEEVEQWFIDNGLTVTWKFSDFYGITMRGIKN